jgi:hypothetical protein
MVSGEPFVPQQGIGCPHSSLKVTTAGPRICEHRPASGTTQPFNRLDIGWLFTGAASGNDDAALSV